MESVSHTLTNSSNNNSKSNFFKTTTQSITQMIQALKTFEEQCKQKQDFTHAQQAKNQIELLKVQGLLIRKEKFDIQNKQNMMATSQESNRILQQFQQRWQNVFSDLVEMLKESQLILIKQHQQQLVQIEKILNSQEQPKIKYSAKTIELKIHFRNLVKSRNYIEAEHAKLELKQRQQQQQAKWIETIEMKKKRKLDLVKRKQQNELKALRVRLQAIFNEQVKERNAQYQKLIKRNKKKLIESTKLNRQRIQSKTALLNQSRALSTIIRN